jgi:hypothetical protein
MCGCVQMFLVVLSVKLSKSSYPRRVCIPIGGKGRFTAFYKYLLSCCWRLRARPALTNSEKSARKTSKQKLERLHYLPVRKRLA